jgi:hypothetical protein
MCAIPLATARPNLIGWREVVTVLPGKPKIEAILTISEENSSLEVSSYRKVIPKLKNLKEFSSTNNQTPTNQTLIPTPTPKGAQSKSYHKVTFHLTDRFGESYKYEVPILRNLKVKLASGRTLVRPIVPLTICIGDIKINGEFALKRGAKDENKIKIGRKDLAGRVIVDPRQKFTQNPGCR